jgi:hypothetical protein
MVTTMHERATGATPPPDAKTAGPKPRDTQSSAEAPHDPPLFDAVQADWANLLRAAQHYFAVRRDLARSQMQMALWQVMAGVVAGVLALTAVSTAMVLVLLGATHGLAEVFGGRLWAGELVVGIVVVSLVLMGTTQNIQRLRSRWHQQTMAKYEHHERRQ